MQSFFKSAKTVAGSKFVILHKQNGSKKLILGKKFDWEAEGMCPDCFPKYIKNKTLIISCTKCGGITSQLIN